MTAPYKIHPAHIGGAFLLPCIRHGAGFFFCPDSIQPDTSVYSVFCAVNAKLYRPRRKTAHTALQRLFLRLHPLNRSQYQTDTTSHCTACATLEGIHTPGRAQPIPDTTATPGRCTGQHRPPIIIRYIRGCIGAPCCGSMPDSAAYRRPCQRRRVSSCRLRIAGKCCTRHTC